MPSTPGRSLLHFRLVEKIGEGGMGEVWRAVDTTLDREVAIKVLPAAFAPDPERVARFEREAKVLASLNHPNIAAIHGFPEAPSPDSGEPLRFLAMEMVEGEDLARILARGALPVREALDAARRPVLQVHGTADASIPIAAARRLTTRLHDARFLPMEGVGHDVHIEAPDLLSEAIASFVREKPALDE